MKRLPDLMLILAGVALLSGLASYVARNLDYSHRAVVCASACTVSESGWSGDGTFVLRRGRHADVLRQRPDGSRELVESCTCKRRRFA